MNPMEDKQFYEKTGAVNGWDFSHIQVTTEGKRWDFFGEVAHRCRKSDLLLDIGTGGGERLLTITDSALLLIGIDHSQAMIRTADMNRHKAGKSNVRFLHMEAEAIAFPDGFFNLVSCRQSFYSAQETARVLVQDGLFLTQQVSPHDKLNLKQAFGRGQGLETNAADLRERVLSELEEVGFSDIRYNEYDAAEYYPSYEDLDYLLQMTPIIPGFGEQENDRTILREFCEKNRTGKGIRTNSKRFMIAAVKK
ncbi:class I SAM-dependent methyltransferase [Paenibacillus sp. 1P03SA]|uniref:class I SAM-dependent methyltransferase n=1 Tax=Paenibacillus sp. 1P03SA TaxID=3132294 RepID=UPI0039A2D24B